VKPSAATTADVPAGVVTVILTVPADPAGDVTLIEVGAKKVTAPADAEPNFTEESVVNPVPTMVTMVPPVVGPAVGLREVTTGAPNVNSSPGWLTALVPAGLVTVTSTVPDPDLVRAEIEVGDPNMTLVPAFEPNLTPESTVKPVPMIVTLVPPAVGTAVGLTEATVGAPNVNSSPGWFTVLVSAGFVTRTSTVAAASAGEVAVRDVGEVTVTLLAATEPNMTVALLVNPDPVTVTLVPPAIGPAVGLTPLTTGVTVMMPKVAVTCCPAAVVLPSGSVAVTDTV
jgi:hypothetical protein